MCLVGLFTEEPGLADKISKALGKDSHDEVLTISNADLQCRGEILSQPDFYILDLQSISPPVECLFESISRANPEATVFVMVPERNAPSAEDLWRFGVDGVLIRPADEKRLCRLIEQLAEKIAFCGRLAALQKKLRNEMRLSQIVAKSKQMRELLQQLPRLATSNSTVLVTGETGTGKELFARAIHYLGPRAGQPFITVDGGTLPESLVENELFGHMRGAYTDAGPSCKGLIQEADGGTLFLDEVEALPMNVQAKFLRFLQEKQFKPLGQSKYIAVNVRIVAATNIDLAEAVGKKSFREDLYYRLNVVPVFIPPLRERQADIPALAQAFLQRHTHEQKTAATIPAATLRGWMDDPWPGNVRELENKVQQWLMRAPEENRGAETASSEKARDLIQPYSMARQEAISLFERAYLQKLLRQTKGNISAAARFAVTDRKHLRTLLKKHGFEAPRFRR